MALHFKRHRMGCIHCGRGPVLLPIYPHVLIKTKQQQQQKLCWRLSAALIANVKNPKRRECPSAGKWVNIPWSPLRTETCSSLVGNSGSQATCSRPTNAGSSPTYRVSSNAHAWWCLASVRKEEEGLWFSADNWAGFSSKPKNGLKVGKRKQLQIFLWWLGDGVHVVEEGECVRPCRLPHVRTKDKEKRVRLQSSQQKQTIELGSVGSAERSGISRRISCMHPFREHFTEDILVSGCYRAGMGQESSAGGGVSMNWQLKILTVIL